MWDGQTVQEEHTLVVAISLSFWNTPGTVRMAGLVNIVWEKRASCAATPISPIALTSALTLSTVRPVDSAIALMMLVSAIPNSRPSYSGPRRFRHTKYF